MFQPSYCCDYPYNHTYKRFACLWADVYMLCPFMKLCACSWCDICYAGLCSYELFPDVIYDILTHEVMSFLLMWYMLCWLMQLWAFSWCDIWYAHSWSFSWCNIIMLCWLMNLWAYSWCDIWYAHLWSYELSPDVIYDMLTHEVMSFLLLWYMICSLV